MIEVIILLIAIGTGLLLARKFPRSTRRWYLRIKAARRTIFGALSLLFAISFIASGVWPLMLIGAAALVYGTVLVVYEKPHEEVKRWIT